MIDVPTASRLFASGRLAYGSGLVASPGRFAGIWIGDDAKRPATQIAVRALGVRDAALGAGIVATADDSRRLRPWLVAAAVSDLVDLVATVGAPAGSISDSARWGTAVVAGISTIAGVAMYLALDD
ncbi:MAG TPA: hypothetical protein VEX36_03115 [Thermoleophilaceae bacterium]|nr:hypothetical protein [Thermoleophilaceae bacterium]